MATLGLLNTDNRYPHPHSGSPAFFRDKHRTPLFLLATTALPVVLNRSEVFDSQLVPLGTRRLAADARLYNHHSACMLSWQDLAVVHLDPPSLRPMRSMYVERCTRDFG